MTGTRARHKAGRHWRGWLRKAGASARKCGEVAGQFARNTATDSDVLLERWQRAEQLLAAMKPINGVTDVTLTGMQAIAPVAEVAGRPPWAVMAQKARRQA